MDCKTTSTRKRGFSLTEMLVAMGVSGIVLGAVAQLSSFSSRSMVAMFNYADLDYYSNMALKQLSRDIRQANSLTEGTDTSLTLDDFDCTPLKYQWNAETKELTRTKSGRTQVLLRGCDFLKFSVFQRNPIGGSYDQYPVAVPGTTKLIQVRWLCARNILGLKVNTESVQSAKFVIRKQ